MQLVDRAASPEIAWQDVAIVSGGRSEFDRSNRLADTTCMMEFELDQLRANPQWVSLLETYRCEARRLGEEVDEFDGWLDRITQLDGLDAAELSRAHGRLIAFGFLSASLGSRRSGLRYQVSRAGIGFLAREAGEFPAESEISESA